ncbi:MAG: Protein containing Heat shock protein Hsp20 protein, partial [Candidatus Nomurabacteria bacterium GW2011_GWB1_43_7]
IENLLISVNYNKVEIKGERRKPEVLSREGKNNYDEQELYWGKFSRSIELPAEIEIDHVSVSEDHGLITIQLPVLNKNRSHPIKIKSI